jgi:hypothetical protein
MYADGGKIQAGGNIENRVCTHPHSCSVDSFAATYLNFFVMTRLQNGS